jgi:replicative DNA helicase
VVECSRRRRLIAAGHQIADLGHELAGDVEAAAAQAAHLVAEVGITDRSPDHGPGLRGAVDGASFVLDAPEGVAAVWGEGDHVLWPSGEGLFLVGPTGVGKTTLGQQLALGRCGLRDEVLGHPLLPDDRRVLYLAADRPAQARRSFRRMVGADDRAALAERLVVWAGPLPFDLAAEPERLAQFAAEHGAGTVVVDSLKDVASELSRDETGSRVNHAFQIALSHGIELLVLHHQRKAQLGNSRPQTLADVYGSTWLTAGAGSVLLLWGEAGDPIVELSHVKQPVAEVGPLTVVHDATTGRSTVEARPDAYSVLQASPAGVTAQEAAKRVCAGDQPERNDIEKARRKLDGLVREGLAHRKEPRKGGAGGGEPARYFLVTHEEVPGS